MIKVSGSEKPNIAAAEVLVGDHLIHRMECFCIVVFCTRDIFSNFNVLAKRFFAQGDED